MHQHVNKKIQSKDHNPKVSSPVQRRVLALAICAVFIPYAFGQLDQAFVMPERLKQLVSLFAIEPTITEKIWRVRLGVTHQGVTPHDVSITLTWHDEEEKEVARNERQLTMGPGDTSYVSLSYINKRSEIQAVTHKLNYQVLSVISNE